MKKSLLFTLLLVLYLSLIGCNKSVKNDSNELEHEEVKQDHIKINIVAMMKRVSIINTPES